jgi:hypothetical protein
VRATVVHGIPSTVVMSAALSVTPPCTSIPCLGLTDGLGNETSALRPLSCRRPATPAPERWERAALGPHARTAAIQWPRAVRFERPTA